MSGGGRLPVGPGESGSTGWGRRHRGAPSPARCGAATTPACPRTNEPENCPPPPQPQWLPWDLWSIKQNQAMRVIKTVHTYHSAAVIQKRPEATPANFWWHLEPLTNFCHQIVMPAPRKLSLTSMREPRHVETRINWWPYVMDFGTWLVTTEILQPALHPKTCEHRNHNTPTKVVKWSVT